MADLSKESRKDARAISPELLARREAALRGLVQALARQAAREHFAKACAQAERQSDSES